MAQFDIMPVLQHVCDETRSFLLVLLILNEFIELSSKFYGICPKVNQVMCTLDTICIPNIMILAHKKGEQFSQIYKLGA